MLGASLDHLQANHQNLQIIEKEKETKSVEEHVMEKLVSIMENQMEKLLVMELVAQLLLLLTVEKSNAEKR